MNDRDLAKACNLPDRCNDGNWREWDQIWTGVEGQPGEMLYTARQPETLLEFWQRCYFEDLWGLLGTDADLARCLELGSGRGTTSMYLAEKGCNVTMVDLSPTAFNQAKHNFTTAGIRLPRMIIADAENTGLPGESFDCIYNIGLLEHFEDPMPLLKESWRLLSKDGLLFSVIVPRRPASQRWLVEMLFAPCRLATRLLRSCAKRILRGSPSGQQIADMVRTQHSRCDYKRWMKGIGVDSVKCIPYNPYYGLWEANLSIGPFLPLYRRHRALKRQFPKLRTWPSVASCDLLWARKT
jgi:ubiquinone/menaquinone biosynthesis C-methylase UbiE